jgi:hypothetical protein
MPGVHQEQRESTFKHIPDRLPQHTRCFHGHVRYTQLLQVIRQGSEVPGHRPEGANLFEQLPGNLATANGTLNRLEMHVQTAYIDEECVHNAPPMEARRRGTSRSGNILLRVFPVAGDNNPGYVSTSGPDSKTGFASTSVRRPLTRRRLQCHQTPIKQTPL